MTTEKRFEDLHVWRSARALVKTIYEVSGHGEFGRDVGLKDQVRRAAVSVRSNIAEGFNAGSDSESTRFLGMGRRSNPEVHSQPDIAPDLKYTSEERFKSICERANMIERALNSMISNPARSTKKVIKEIPATSH